MNSWLRILCGLVLGLSMVACGGGNSLVDRAGQVLDETITDNADYAEYASRLLANGSSSFSTDRLATLLQSEKYTIAQEAVRGYANNPEIEANDLLTEAFNNMKGGSKVLAAVALSRRGDNEAQEYLVTQIDRTAGSAQELTMLTLVAAGKSEEVQERLQTLIESKEPSLRNRAYEILGQIDEEWSREMLRAGLEKEFGEERLGPIVALGKVGTAEDAKRIAKFSNTRGLVFATAEALGYLGNPDVAEEPLTKLIEQDEVSAQTYAATAMLRLGILDEENPILETLSEHPDPSLRETLAIQLVGIESDRAHDLLKKLSQDEDGSVREAALFTLTENLDPDDREIFAARLEDNNSNVVSLSLETLSKIGADEDIPAIEPFLEHQLPFLRVAAAIAIGEISAR